MFIYKFMIQTPSVMLCADRDRARHYAALKERKMKRQRTALVILFALGVALLARVTPAAAQTQVLVDATSGSSIWWFPQSGPFFNPDLDHQGKPLLDFLRNRGIVVTELVPGSTVSCRLLSQYELVIETDGQTTSFIPELSGYVSHGGRLILLNDYNPNNAGTLNLSFGLEFTGMVSGLVSTFTPHPITTGVTGLNYIAGSIVTAYPSTATILGSLSGLPVMGVMSFGLGQLFFIGETNGIQQVPQPLVNNLFNFLLTGASQVNACAVTTRDLIAAIAGLHLSAGEMGSLTAKVAAADAALSRGNTTAASNQLMAFINQVQALVLSGRLGAGEADRLITIARSIA
jgi:hypothetical protein